MKKKEKLHLSSKKHVGAFNQPLIFFLFICLIFSVTGARLFWIQIIRGSYYKKLSEENRVKLIANPPIRGRLLDRNGVVLADNKLFYSLAIQPRLLTKSEWIDLRNSLSDLLNVSTDQLEIAFNRSNSDTPYKKVLLTDLSVEQVIRFKEQENNLYGAQIDIGLIRNYPYKSLAAHALGYTQLITQNEFSKLSERGYKLSDRIGRKGIEAAFESQLRGAWGGEMLEIDSIGTVQRSLGSKLPKAGRDIKLTLDLELQLTAEKVLSDKIAGAIVAIDPYTGAIRAIASQPTFDLNFFSQPFTNKQYNDLFLSSNLPLLSRAFNAYDPGSTWKPVTAIAGMESGKFPARQKLNTVPCITYGSHCFPEYNKRGFGWIGYEDAFRVSSNTFFYQVGVGTGSKALYDAAIKLGFDNYTGIETLIDDLRSEGDSVGARIEIMASNLPVGLGEPVFDKLDADIAKGLMSINAVKGVEIGNGFDLVSAKGSDSRDEITPEGFKTNSSGGIAGGISTGQEIIAGIALKPTSSIVKEGDTVDTSGKATKVAVKGRHDPCVGIRATPIAEAMMALVLMDHFLRNRAQNADVVTDIPDIS